MSHLPLDTDPAHAVRATAQLERDPEPAFATSKNLHQDVFAQIRHALAVSPLIGFDMGTTAVIEDGAVAGRVWVRAGGKTWTLTTLDAATFAIVMRCDAMRGAAMFADAFALAAQDAERRVDAIHAWSGHIRPTEDVE